MPRRSSVHIPTIAITFVASFVTWFVAAAFSGSVRSQTPSGADTTAGRLQGTIYDRHGPRSDATIQLESARGLGKIATADEDGHYQLRGLHPGHWTVTVSAEGCLDSSGFVIIDGAITRLDVELRRLDERTPRFAEGASRAEVEGWLERGNALVARGQAAEARAEYQKTLRHLDAAQRAEVLRGIARTYYLENDLKRARRSLESALALDPSSTDTRALLEALPRVPTSRSDTATQSWEAHQVSTGHHPRARRPRLPVPPLTDLNPQLVGAHTVRLSERNPLGLLAEVDRRHGLEPQWVADAKDYDSSSERFALVVPPELHQRPPNRQDPSDWGAIVWISPTADGRPPSAEITAVLARHRLIWIGAHHAGNPRPLWERIGLALDAAQAVQRTFDLAGERLVVGGYSGGGRLAAATALHWPEVFSGAVSWFGVSWYEPVPVPYQPGSSWAPTFRKPTQHRLRQLRRDSRFALVTGDLDFNRSETVKTHELMRRARLQASLFQIPDADHYAGLIPEWLARSLAVLEGPTRDGDDDER